MMSFRRCELAGGESLYTSCHAQLELLRNGYIDNSVLVYVVDELFIPLI